jgi:hypothetical protein
MYQSIEFASKRSERAEATKIRYYLRHLYGQAINHCKRQWAYFIMSVQYLVLLLYIQGLILFLIFAASDIQRASCFRNVSFGSSYILILRC